MAFVSKEPRRIFSVPPHSNAPAPCDKPPQPSPTAKKPQTPAPFNSTVSRSNQKVAQQPGPGSYNLSNDLAKPKILEQSYDSLIRILESPTPTNQFKSGSKRFRSDDNKVPGPGAYTESRPNHQHHNSTPFRCASTKILEFLKKQRKPNLGSIVGLNPMLKEFEMPVQTKRKQKKLVVPSAFFKSRVERTIAERPKTTLGPGSYDLSKTFSISNAPTAPNSSQTKRRPIKSSSSLARCKLPSENQNPVPSKVDDLMNINVGPGYYYDQRLFSSFKIPKPTPNQFFGSTVERFHASKNDNLGPGTYNLDQNGQNLANQSSSFFKSKQKRFGVNTDCKGPGCYNPMNTFGDLLQELKRKGPKNRVGGKANRFKMLRTQTPGPGYYDSQKQPPKARQKSAVFMQSRNRQIQHQCPPPGTYDLTSHTIGNRITTKKNDQNSHSPPFLSCQRRFKQPMEQDYITNAIPCHRHDHESPKRPTTSSIPFRSSQQRFGGRQHPDLPGPANYTVESKLTKQSFNIMFCR